MDEQFRVYLSDGVSKIAERRDPGAVHWLARAAQRAVDRLDGIARGAHHDERDRVLVCQGRLHWTRIR